MGRATYSVSVRDNFSCNAPSQSVFIDAPDFPLKIENTAFELPKGYNTADGSLTLQISGGTAPYRKMEWIDANNNPQTRAVISETTNTSQTEKLDFIPGSVYKVTGKDSNFCEVTELITLNSPPRIRVSGILDSIKCHNESNGILTLSTTGGVLNGTISDYSYVWFYTPIGGTETSLSGDSKTRDNLAAGVIRVIVEDANGISGEQTFDIPNPIQVALDLKNSMANFCPTAPKGQLLVKGSGGKTPYTLSWEDNPSFSGFEREELSAGTYEATLTDANGCFVSLNSIVIDSSQFFTPNISYTEPSCYGKCDAELAVNISAGNAPFFYSWSNLNDTLKANSVLTGVCSDVNSTILTVKDNLGCIIMAPAFSLTSPPPRPINLPISLEVCPSEPFMLDGSQSWGVNYSWLTPTNQTFNTSSINGDTLGTYSLLIEDALGCFGKTDIEVIQNQNVSNFFGSASKALLNKEVVLVDLSSPAPSNISWDYPSSATVISQDAFTLKLVFSQTGDFKITQFATIDGCTYPFSKNISILNHI